MTDVEVVHTGFGLSCKFVLRPYLSTKRITRHCFSGYRPCIHLQDNNLKVERIEDSLSLTPLALTVDIPRIDVCAMITIYPGCCADYATVWVHPENLLELKTLILRRLPVLIYNPLSSKVADGQQRDPTVTSVYFDNPQFSLYNAKVSHTSDASSLRVRWYDQLSVAPEIFIEKKTVHEDDTTDEMKFTTKPKYIQPFLSGEYKMDKDVQRLKDRLGEDSEEVTKLQKQVEEVQSFIKENKLQPVVRANYQRTAFQIPGDNRVRITLDTNLALIREDALDPERPCRDPESWHRKDIDDGDMEFPFTSIRKGEINRFPFALLEIRIRGNKQYEWVSELMSSHLVKQSPRFSKFVQGVAQLFDDYVNTFPFWLSEVDTDIRRDPHQAFEEEQERKAKTAEAEFAVGSMISSARRASAANFKASTISPVGSPSTTRKNTPVAQPKEQDGKSFADMTRTARASKTQQNDTIAEEDEDEDTVPEDGSRQGLSRFLPNLSMSKYAGRHRHGQVKLPPGVTEPAFWIKDEGPVKVEAKVYLANQRTYIKWQHVSILLATLSVGLYNAAGEHNDIARALAVVYTVVALFTALWGYGIYWWRSQLIAARSGKDFDNAIGPVVVCLALIVALCVNFGYKWDQAVKGRNGAGREGKHGSHGHSSHGTNTADDERLLDMAMAAGQVALKNATEAAMAAWEEL